MNKKHITSKFLVYGLIEPHTGNLRYVGKSSSGMKRAKSHQCESAREHSNTHVCRWLRKIYKEFQATPCILVLAECVSNDEALDREQEIIAMFKDAGIELVNITAGGQGMTGWHPTEETRMKLSRSLKGKRKGILFSQEHKDRLRESMIGRTFSDESIQKMVKSRTGKKQTPDHIENNRLANIGRKLTLEHRAKISAARIGKSYPRENKSYVWGY